MQDFSGTMPDNKQLVKNDREDYGVSLLFGFITSMVLISVIGGAFLTETWLVERIIIHISLIAGGLQIFPFLFSLIARKYASLQKFGLAIFWLTLLLELIVMTILMASI